METILDGTPTSVFVPPALVRDVLDGDAVTARWRIDDTGDRTATHLEVTARTRTLAVGVVRPDNQVELDPGIGSGTVPCVGLDSRNAVGSVVACAVDTSRTDRIELRFERDLGTGEPALRDRILIRHQIPLDHERSVLEAADAVVKATSRKRRSRPGAATAASTPSDQDRAARADLTDQFVVTIDADHSRDLDDALAVRREADGILRVWVHVADVAEYVTEGSVLDRAAAQMPTSVYLPGHVRPMIPASVSEAALSVLPELQRDVMTVELRIDADGSIVATDVYESTIRSRRRLSYDTVEAVLVGKLTEGSRALGDFDAPLDAQTIETIQILHAAASRLGFQRRSRGGVDANRVLLELPFGASKEATVANVLVERLMVAANESVASWLAERGAPGMYRNHLPIDADKLDELEAVTGLLGVQVSLSRPITPRAFGAFAATIEHHPSAPAIWDVVMGLLNRASYGPNNDGHFGLGSEGYVHFTSPLRRYADLVVHRIVKKYLSGVRPIGNVRWGVGDLNTIATVINDANRRADAAERDATRATELALIPTDDRRIDGMVVSVAARGVTVATGLGPIAGVIPARRLPKGWVLDLDRRRVTTGERTIAVGDKIAVKVESVDPLVGRFELRFADGQQTNRRASRASERGAGRRKAAPASVPSTKKTSLEDKGRSGRPSGGARKKAAVTAKPASNRTTSERPASTRTSSERSATDRTPENKPAPAGSTATTVTSDGAGGSKRSSGTRRGSRRGRGRSAENPEATR